MSIIKIFSSELGPHLDGKIVRVAGWVYKIRIVGKIVFLRVVDREGDFQIIIKRGEVPDEIFEKAKELTPMTAVIVEGRVRKANTKGGFEIVPLSLNYNLASTPLPVDVFKGTTELDKRVKYRTLDLRDPKNAAIFKIKSIISNAYREFLLSKGFVEIHTPSIGVYVAEGGANVFEIKYFDRKAYLRQSPQLYKQLMAGALERVFEIGPAFRAEPSHTVRHLTEFTSMDAEIAWIRDHYDVMEVLENTVKYIIETVSEKGKEEFEKLDISPPKPLKTPLPKLKYEDAIALIEDEGIRVEGKDIPPKGEEFLHKYVLEKYGSEAFFIVDYPWSIRPFYTMKYEDSSEDPATKSMDLIYRGIEIATGGQREHRYKVLYNQIKEKGLKPENFGFYLEAFKYGMPPHGGWGLGLDRLTMKVIGLSNVREAVLYPRDPETLEP